MKMRKWPLLLAVVLLVVAGAGGFVFYQASVPTPAPTLEQHLAAELARLRQHEGTGELSPVEASIAGKLRLDASVDDLKQEFVHHWGRELSKRLEAYAREHPIMLSQGLLFTRSEDNGWNEFERACERAALMAAGIDQWREDVSLTTSDSVDPTYFEPFLTLSKLVEAHILSAAAKENIWSDRVFVDKERDQLVPLAHIMATRARLLDLMNSRDALAGLSAFWKVVSLVGWNDSEGLAARARAGSIVLEAAVQLLGDGTWKTADFNQFLQTNPDWRPLGAVFLRLGWRTIDHYWRVEALTWRHDSPEIDNIVRDQFNRFGAVPLQQWIDRQFEVGQAEFDKLAMVTKKLDDQNPDVSKPDAAREAISALRQDFEANRTAVESWLLTWMPEIYLAAISVLAQRDDADRTTALRSIAISKPHVAVLEDDAGNLSFRLDSSHPMAEFIPADANEAVALAPKK